MDSSLKKKNILLIVFEILMIGIGITGITFAISKLFNDRTSTMLTADEYGIDYVGDTEIHFNNLMPISDNLVGYNTSSNVVRIEFSLRGDKKNKDSDLIYDVMLNEMNIDCSLLNKYTKWNLYKNGEIIANGSLDPAFDGDVLGDTMRLTNTQEDLPRYNQDYDNYVLLFWISESCGDLTTCELVDQSNIVDSTMSMKVFIAVYSGSKTNYERKPNYDHTCANKPELLDNMVPVKYENNTLVVASQDNSDGNNLWYSYSDGRWPNAVVVSDSSKYIQVGEVVSNADILGYYVWIPRYRYKLWNATERPTDSYDAYNKGVEIVFENGLSSKTVDKYENNKYITHPAFGDNLRGFWIGKYELSLGDNYMTISEVTGYHNTQVDAFDSIMSGLVTDYNLGDKTVSSVVSNLEWGATVYLAHSKYGLCKNGSCNNISGNETYATGTNNMDTTTGNIYGVFDMAGAASEYVVGASGIGSATSEVMLGSGTTWYNNQGIPAGDYLIRGGVGRGLYYYAGLSMSTTEIGVRNVLKRSN